MREMIEDELDGTRVCMEVASVTGGVAARSVVIACCDGGRGGRLLTSSTVSMVSCTNKFIGI